MRSLASFLCLAACLLALPAQADDVFDSVADGKYDDAKATAKQSGDKLLQTFALWASLRDPAAPAISFSDGYSFLAAHPDWPDQNLIRLRTEEAALDGNEGKSALRSYCDAFPPISGRGMFACAIAGAGNQQQRLQWISQGWRQGDFSDYEQALILSTYGRGLTAADHTARTDRLLFEGKVSDAKEMLPYVPKERRPLYAARLALIGNAKDAPKRFRAVPPQFAHDPGLLFDRIRYDHHKNDDDAVLALFLIGPKDPPYADLWWPLRALTVRDAFSQGKYKEAVAILAAQGADLKPEQRAEALFLKGWIALQYLHDPHGAYKDFYALYTQSATPISKARAAYWAAEAARQNNNPDIARQWREKAAQRPTVFYGQLAFEQLHPNTPLPLPPQPEVDSAQAHDFENEDMVKLVHLLADHQQKLLADHFMAHLASNTDSPARLTLIAKLARDVGQPEGAVKVAKVALKQGIILVKDGWPVMPVPQGAVEPALALSIIRQESEFDSSVASGAGAVGLMQLVPSTAALTARHTGLPYDGKNSLLDPKVNIALGSEYLGHIIDVMDGSYVLGIAAYNAGPGRVGQWQKEFGAPGKTPREVVDWIENIPYSETRNYVMRGMENIEIYRALLSPSANLQIEENLVRGAQ